MKNFLLTSMILLISLNYNSYAETGIEERELEKWFESDEDISTDHVNEGKLRFLSSPPLKPSLHSINRISISQQSMVTGWVLLEQCYENLDPVASTEIVYQYKNIRNLHISAKQNIEKARVNIQSVYLEDISKNAKLCIKAEVKILNKLENGNYSLVNGPFHRQFLDGYYPYHLSLYVNYPSSRLKLVSTSPASQKGFMVKISPDTLHIDTEFEGRLTIELLFMQIVIDA